MEESADEIELVDEGATGFEHEDVSGEGEIEELIIATNPTVEGEATAHYLAQLARAGGVRPTRLAHGVPLGGELEYVDRGTLAHAFGSRQLLD